MGLGTRNRLPILRNFPTYCPHALDFGVHFRVDYIVSSDEKTSIQARIRCHPTLPIGPGRPMRVEHEYERGGALQYLAAWDVRRGQILGRCEGRTGIEPFGCLVEHVMKTEPYRSADRVFWVVDSGSSHRGQAAINRLSKAYRKAVLVHTPVHASWLNQVEIYFSIIQRKVLTPNDFASLDEVEQRPRLYEELTNREPRPFDWKIPDSTSTVISISVDGSSTAVSLYMRSDDRTWLARFAPTNVRNDEIESAVC